MKQQDSYAKRRKVDLVVISDVHLGTYGCHAKALLQYMKSIDPKQVVLNGDIVDMWQFRKRYWPHAHMKVLKQIVSWAARGVEVHYITGNHDELLRKFTGFELGSLSIKNKLVLQLDNQKVWFFHGDVFDVTMQYSPWLTRLGAVGYDLLILINRIANRVSERMGRGRLSLSKKIKNSVKSAVKYINQFESVCADIAIEQGYDVVVCGHIHQPEIRKIQTQKGDVWYMNSGDWVENLTALEYHKGNWSICNFRDLAETELTVLEPHVDSADLAPAELFANLVLEFRSMTPTH